MVEVDIYKNIVAKDDGVTLENIKKVFSDNPEENDFMFNINSNGGSTGAGLAIYDLLRTSGKNIHTNIEGKCHSMALTLLLAAPKENRSGNVNSKGLTHPVYSKSNDFLNSEEMRILAEKMDEEMEKILNIHSDRTGTDLDVLRNLMKNETTLDSNELLQYGFISKINTYNTNLKTNEMDIKNLSENVEKIYNKLFNINQDDIVNADFTDADGNVVFTSETDTIEVGTAVTGEDGTYILADGRAVTIEAGVVTVIDPAAEEEVVNEEDDKLKSLQAENEELKLKLAELTNTVEAQNKVVEDAKEMVNSLRSDITSIEEIPTRKTTAKTVVNQSQEIINQAKESYKKFKTN